MSELTGEILCLGNELLIGRTVNKNATDIGLRLTREGITVTRVTTIRDELELGITVLKEILARKPDVLCITGGLGPTFDDIQLDVISQAIEQPLEINNIALNMVKSRYDIMNEYREKMAKIPHGSTPLHNSEGSAPGVSTRFQKTLIFSLPGVPREMLAIMDEEVIPIIIREFETDQRLVEYSCTIRGARESAISGISDAVMKKYPEVSFKSHPMKDEKGFYLILQTYALTDEKNKVREALDAWLDEVDKKFGITRGQIESTLSNSEI